jgi:hypothetical protein
VGETSIASRSSSPHLEGSVSWRARVPSHVILDVLRARERQLGLHPWLGISSANESGYKPGKKSPRLHAKRGALPISYQQWRGANI